MLTELEQLRNNLIAAEATLRALARKARAFDWIGQHLMAGGGIGYGSKLERWFLYSEGKNIASGATLLEAVEKVIGEI